MRAAVNIHSYVSLLQDRQHRWLLEKRTCIRQTEGAVVFAPVIPQEDLVNTNITLGDLEFDVKATLVSLRRPPTCLPLETNGGGENVVRTKTQTVRQSNSQTDTN